MTTQSKYAYTSRASFATPARITKAELKKGAIGLEDTSDFYRINVLDAADHFSGEAGREAGEVGPLDDYRVLKSVTVGSSITEDQK